jgi:hypothetical protein
MLKGRSVQISRFQYFKDQPKLIDHVARGEQDEAEKILKVTDEKLRVSVLSKKNKVTDASGRKFEPILPLHYALWALDWHMWKMLLTYLPKDTVIKQLKEFEEKGVTYHRSIGDKKEEKVTEKHFDLLPLISKLNHFVKECKEVIEKDKEDPEKNNDFEKLKTIWCNGVGGEQKKVPAHVAHEYCHPERNFYSASTFDEPSLPRKAEFFVLKHGNVHWFSIDSGLGSQFAISRSSGISCRGYNGLDIAYLNVESDASALKALRDVRMQQFENFKKNYLEPGISPAVSVMP